MKNSLAEIHLLSIHRELGITCIFNFMLICMINGIDIVYTVGCLYVGIMILRVCFWSKIDQRIFLPHPMISHHTGKQCKVSIFVSYDWTAYKSLPHAKQAQYLESYKYRTSCIS